MKEVIYLDNNATTRMDERVLEAMLPLFREQYGNPASGHAFGRAASEAVERARQAVAQLIGASGGRIVFTASATEANNLAIAGLAAKGGRIRRLVTTTIEHKSVIEPAKRLELTGRARVTWLRPDGQGQIQPEELQAALKEEAQLVSIIAASNVIHTINPMAELAAICAAHGVLLHCDATQLVGKVPLSVDRLGIDAISLSAHKLYGPKGVGALYLSQRALRAGVEPQVLGGGQEEGIRSGTLNVPAIVGLGAACALAAERTQSDAAQAEQLAQLLLDGLRRHVSGITLNGHPKQRIPGGLNLTLDGVDSKGLIALVPEVAFSDGSACETQREPDYVLKAIGRPEAAHHSIRFQVGRATTRAEIETATGYLVAGIKRMRAMAL